MENCCRVIHVKFHFSHIIYCLLCKIYAFYKVSVSHSWVFHDQSNSNRRWSSGRTSSSRIKPVKCRKNSNFHCCKLLSWVPFNMHHIHTLHSSQFCIATQKSSQVVLMIHYDLIWLCKFGDAFIWSSTMRRVLVSPCYLPRWIICAFTCVCTCRLWLN